MTEPMDRMVTGVTGIDDAASDGSDHLQSNGKKVGRRR